MSYFDVSGISKSYHGIPVFSDIQFVVDRGQFTWVRGDNGSGKTTLCKIIAGMIKPDQGQVRFQGKEIVNMSAYKRMHDFLAYMPQESVLLYDYSVKQNLDFTRELLGNRKYTWPENISKLLKELFNTDNFGSKATFNLSRGERRKLDFYIMLMADSAIYLFDEPFSGLDQKSKKIISDILGLLKKGNKTIVLIEHDVPSELNQIIDQKVEL
jgi:ABC-type multidrug transport system ATPase subunit